MISSRIETAAQEILTKAGVKTAPIGVDKIAKFYDIEIKRGPSDDFSGLLLRKEDKAYIGVNSNEPETRQRFTIAHELGHYILHKNSNVFIEFRDNKRGAIHSPKEVEANAFAAALLMPLALMEKDVEGIAKKGIFGENEIRMLSEKYDVSEDAMKIRLINMSCVTGF